MKIRGNKRGKVREKSERGKVRGRTFRKGHLAYKAFLTAPYKEVSISV